jgi:hypothetical protein
MDMSKFGKITDMILHDVITVGVLSASIFVKNPAHQETAGKLINAVAQLLPMLDAQLNPGNVTIQNDPAPVVPAA